MNRRFLQISALAAQPMPLAFFNPCYFDQFPEAIPRAANMGQSKPYSATALVVEDDPMQREMLCVLLEESNYAVIQCESAEAAELVLDKYASTLALLITDVSLAGRMNGVELARIATKRNPDLDVVVTSGRALPEPLPTGAKFWSKPWAPLDILREAEFAQVRRAAH
jgi:CheY-like chemotaxis protein